MPDSLSNEAKPVWQDEFVTFREEARVMLHGLYGFCAEVYGSRQTNGIMASIRSVRRHGLRFIVVPA